MDHLGVDTLARQSLFAFAQLPESIAAWCMLFKSWTSVAAQASISLDSASSSAFETA